MRRCCATCGASRWVPDVLIHARRSFTPTACSWPRTWRSGRGAVHFLPRFEADAITRCRAALMGVPPHKASGSSRADRGHGEHAAIHAGLGAVIVDTHEKWQARTGHRILERYGMTETGMSTSNPFEGERRPGTVGLLPGVELRVMDATGFVPTGEIGVIEVRGPNVFRATGTCRKDRRGDAPGRLVHHRRPGDRGRPDMSPSSAKRTWSSRAVSTSTQGGGNRDRRGAGVRESAVIGVPHPRSGRGRRRHVVAEDPALAEADVAAAIGARAGRVQAAQADRLTGGKPRNTMGKVQKKGPARITPGCG